MGKHSSIRHINILPWMDSKQSMPSFYKPPGEEKQGNPAVLLCARYLDVLQKTPPHSSVSIFYTCEITRVSIIYKLLK